MSENGGGEGGGSGADLLGGGGGEGGGAPEWLTGLPEELRGDATLTRYKNIEELARGHVEAHRVAKSKVLLPGADADDAAWDAFYDAAGRPKDPAAYKIEVPEGESSELADKFRPVAHKLGLLPRQVEGIVAFNNALAAQSIEALNAQSRAGVDELKAELGDQFDTKIAAAKQAALRLGLDPDIATKIDAEIGSKALLKTYINLAELMGEHARVDGGDPPGGGGDPKAALDAKMKDASWREKVKAAGSPERAEYDRLRDAVAKREQIRSSERRAS